jgi:hypothetical protein
MSIRVECTCGKTIEAESVFAGGQVKCLCGAMVPVPNVDPKLVDKIRFHCPHCKMRVLGKRSSIGKKSKCPGCGKAYVIPEPKPEPTDEPAASPAGFKQRQRIQIGADDIAFMTELLPSLVDEPAGEQCGNENATESPEAETREEAGEVLVQAPVQSDPTASTTQPCESTLSLEPPATDLPNVEFSSFVEEIVAEIDSGISVDPPPTPKFAEIRIDLTGGRGTPPSPARSTSPDRDVTTSRTEDEVRTKHRNATSRESTHSAHRSQSLPELDRKTELPVDDDTIRTPVRPLPQPSGQERRNQPAPPKRPISQPEIVGFTDEPFPSPSIPLEELRLVDSPESANQDEFITTVFAPEAQVRKGLADTGRIALDTSPGRVGTSESAIGAGAPEQSAILPPRPVSKRPLSSPPVGGVSIFSPIVRSVAQPGRHASLIFVDGEAAGRTVPLNVKNFLIGRERDCHFRPSSPSVSHHHCVLKTDAYAVRIRDLGSRNGTFVNGHRIHKEVLLHHSDSIWIGDVRFKVDIPHDLYAGYHGTEAQLSVDEFLIY